MKKTILDVQGMYELLFGNPRVISILELPVSVRGLDVKSPLNMNLHNLMQPAITHALAEHIFNQLRDKEIEAIVGCDTTRVLSFTVADKLDVPFFPIFSNEKIENLKGKKVAFVTDIITQGKDTVDSLKIINRYDGFCEEICSIFDYNMNLDVGLKNVNTNSLFDFSDMELLFNSITDMKSILAHTMLWKEMHQDLFGKVNRKEVFDSNLV